VPTFKNHSGAISHPISFPFRSSPLLKLSQESEKHCKQAHQWFLTEPGRQTIFGEFCRRNYALCTEQ